MCHAFEKCQWFYSNGLFFHINTHNVFNQKLAIVILALDSQSRPPQQAKEQLVKAAILWGASNHLNQEEDHFLYRTLLKDLFQKAVLILKEGLPDDRFGQALATGDQMTADEVVNFILSIRL
jgi:hypothetical protein